MDAGAVPAASTKNTVDSNQYSGRVAIFGYDSVSDGGELDFDRAMKDFRTTRVTPLALSK